MKVRSPDPPVHSSRTKFSRRTFFGVTLAGAGVVAMTHEVPDDLKRAVQSHRKAATKFVEVESAYQSQAPDLIDDYPGMRRLEDRLQSALGAIFAASEAIMDRLAESGLAGVVDGGSLYLATILEPEGIRRLVIAPSDRIRGL